MSGQILASLRDLGRLAGGNFTFSERIAYLKEFGIHSQAFSTLQPDMQYFDMEGVGYIAYMRKWGHLFVLSDPVCAPENFEKIIVAFCERFPSANFIQCSRSTTEILNQRFGYYGTRFGSEIRIDLQKWSLSGKKKQIIRTAINQAEKQGVVIKERFSDDHTREISEAWIRTRKCKSNEIRFLIRPMEMNYRENERHFYAYQDGKPVGFVYFDPIYSNNQIVSYVPNISRANADFKQGLFYPLIVHAMEVFKAEGIPYLDLGLVPLMMDEKMGCESANEAHESALLKKMFRLTWEKGNFLYNFKGLAFTKSRFRGDVEPTYVCSRASLPLLQFIAMFRLTRVI